jgi:hypothetical protein
MITARGVIEGVSQYIYYYFDAETGLFDIPADYIIAPYLSGTNIGVSSGVEDTYLLISEGVSQDKYDCIYAQQLSNNSVSVSDPINESTPAIYNVTNLPNPFGIETKISYTLEHNAKCKVNIYNIKGQLVRSIPQDYASKGVNQIVWDGRDANGFVVGNGVYFYQISSGVKQVTRKMCLVK